MRRCNDLGTAAGFQSPVSDGRGNSRRHLRRWVARLALLLGTLSLMLLVVELGLRTLGWCSLRGRAREIESTLPTGAYRILNLGESVTYGLFVDRDQAYPAQIEKILSARHPGRRFVSLNRGVPGITSSAILDTVEEKLGVYRPNLVTVMWGPNDFNEQLNGLIRPVPRLLAPFTNLRLYRVLRHTLARRNTFVHDAQGDLIYYHDYGNDDRWALLLHQPFDMERIRFVQRTLQANVEAMVERASARGAKVLFLGTPVSYRFPPDAMIERAARAVGASFVSTQVASLPESERRALYTQDNAHPGPLGHERIARLLADAIDSLLAQE